MVSCISSICGCLVACGQHGRVHEDAGVTLVVCIAAALGVGTPIGIARAQQGKHARARGRVKPLGRVARFGPSLQLVLYGRHRCRSIAMASAPSTPRTGGVFSTNPRQLRRYLNRNPQVCMLFISTVGQLIERVTVCYHSRESLLANPRRRPMHSASKRRRRRRQAARKKRRHGPRRRRRRRAPTQRRPRTGALRSRRGPAACSQQIRAFLSSPIRPVSAVFNRTPHMTAIHFS